ncbi:TonB-dependent siderophore receptor [Novosphingobium terrae]|uniref:TonB-dependent siderophore receptor n=1 Tax=Novosphingobium terrae TaxID=2726189 RepID=UPI00197EACC7|nr:TonB-dependent receptor [Novosphingobium terrae]
MLDLPAGTLGQTIAQLGRKAGVMIVFDPALLRGRNSAGLHGAYTMREALSHLLAGTLVEARSDGHGGYVLTAAPAPEAPRRPKQVEHHRKIAIAPGQSVARPPMEGSDDILVIAQRSSATIVASGHQISLLDRDQVATQRTASDTLSTILAKTIPGLSDSSHTITDYGQTLRGRGVLVLVDGVPYNTNRESARTLASVDPGTIDRVEVLRGGSAIYGSGATGGIIAIATRPAGGPLRIETEVAATSALSRLSGSGLGGRTQTFVTGSVGRVDLAVNGGFQRISGSFDGDGNRRAPEPSQGDLYDSNVWNLGAKIGWHLGSQRYLQLSGTLYRADQHTDYAADPAQGRLTPGTAIGHALGGLVLADQNQLHSSTATINYSDRDLLGSRLSLLGYYRVLFTRFTPFDARAVSTRGNNVDQVMQNSRVLGARATIETLLGTRTSLTWGGDVNRENSHMPDDIFDPAAYDRSGGLVFNRTGTLMYMPPLTTLTYGGFLQMQHRLAPWLAVDGGLRYDRASISFDSFVPLSQYRAAVPQTIQGGSTSYGAWTFNGSATLTPAKGHDLYASFSQGFQLPDVGLQLRNATPGFSINNSDLQPVKIDNYEIGYRSVMGKTRAGLALFRTTSQLGDVQSFNNGLTLLRTAERIKGIETSIDVGQPSDPVRVGGSATYMVGRERASGATNWQAMTGYRIPPFKLTLYMEVAASQRLDLRLQGLFVGDRDYRLNGVASYGRRDVTGYATLDAVATYRLDERNKLTLGVENLLNRQYLPLYSQLLRNNLNTSRVPAAGATATLSLRHRW